MPLQASLDTVMIRMALSLDGPMWSSFKQEARGLLGEQLVVIVGGHCSAEATSYRNYVYTLAYGEGDAMTAEDRYRFEVVSRLFNDDIRQRGVVLHRENNCCNSSADTLKR